MRLQNKTIDGEDKKVLEVYVYDDNDITEIRTNYSHCECVQIDLSSLQYLDLFQRITTLILTGGVPTPEGLQCLYNQKDLDTLVLDFEETDSDEEGVKLNLFPNLKYVLSRSNLNIYNCNPDNHKNMRMEILNFYKDGRKLNVEYASNYNLFQKKKFLFFSTESKSPTSMMIIEILRPIEKILNEKFNNIDFSQNLDSVAIIPICMPDSMLVQGFGKERRLVSRKKRFADVRLQIPYNEFVLAERTQQIIFCRENIEKAALYISTKDKTFALQEFLSSIDCAFSKIGNSDEK